MGGIGEQLLPRRPGSRRLVLTQRDLLPLAEAQAAALQPATAARPHPSGLDEHPHPVRRLVSMTASASVMKPPPAITSQNRCTDPDE